MSGHRDNIGDSSTSLGSSMNDEITVSTMTSTEISGERTLDIQEVHPCYKDQVQPVIDPDSGTDVGQCLEISVGVDSDSSVEQSAICTEKMTINDQSSSTNVARCSANISTVKTSDGSSITGIGIVQEYVLNATNGNAAFVIEAAFNRISFHDQSSIPLADAFVVSNYGDNYSNVSNELCIVQIDEMNQTNVSTNLVRTASDRTRTTAQLSNSGYDSNDTTSSNSATKNDDIDAKIKNIAVAAIQTERKFWIRFVIIAILLNTILVASVVIAGFCGTGNCHASNSVAIDVNVANATSSLSPPISLSQSPTMSPSQYIFINVYPTEESIAVDSNKSSATNDTNLTYDPDGSMPDNSTTPPDNSTTNNAENSTTNDNDNSTTLSVGLLVGIAITAELLIVSILFLYHRRWKRTMERRKIHDCNIIDTIPQKQIDISQK